MGPSDRDGPPGPQVYIFEFIFFIFYSILKITPPTPTYPPLIYFMTRYIYINILKVSGMVRERTGGLVVGSGGGVGFVILEEVFFASPLTLGVLNAPADFRLFFGIYCDQK